MKEKLFRFAARTDAIRLPVFDRLQQDGEPQPFFSDGQFDFIAATNGIFANSSLFHHAPWRAATYCKLIAQALERNTGMRAAKPIAAKCNRGNVRRLR